MGGSEGTGAPASEWHARLHELRRREFERIFGGLEPGVVGRALELGAGDGHQSRLLARVATEVVATDYAYASQEPPLSDPRIDWRFADAEEVDDCVRDGPYDLIFSSNLLEHLPDPSRALRGAARVMAPDGVMVHVMPSPFWKLCGLALFFPFQAGRLVAKLGRAVRTGRGGGPGEGGAGWRAENNPKVERSRGWWRENLWPTPHGAYRTNLGELWAFRRRRWKKVFRRSGLTVSRVARGPVASGYGLGLDRIRTLLEMLGFAGEFIYVAHRPGERPPLAGRLLRGGAGSAAQGSAATRSRDGTRR